MKRIELADTGVLLSVIVLLTWVLPSHAQDILGGESKSEETSELTETINVGAEKPDDAAIKKRLMEVYKNIEALQGIEVSVSEGVVKLTGKTQTKEAHEKALQLASRVDGVVSVDDAIVEERSVGSRTKFVTEQLVTRIHDLVTYLPLALLSVVVLILFWFLASLAVRWDSLFVKISKNIFLQTILKQITRGAIMLVGFLVILQILDATALLTTLLGAAGLLGLAIGFAIRDTVENYIASILLSLHQPFDSNDHVQIEGQEGLVIRLTSRETVLMTLDGNHVRIPNAAVYKGVITNYTRNPKRRFTFTVGIDTNANLAAAQGLAIQTLASTAGVIEDPPPNCLIDSIGESSIALLMLGWTDQTYYDFGKVKGEAIRAVKKAFDTAGYEMPEPIYRIRMQQGLTELAAASEFDTPPVVRPVASTSSDEAMDIKRDTHIEKQISDEKNQDREQDLLDSQIGNQQTKP